MMVLLSFALHIIGPGGGHGAITATVPLPVRAETAAWAVPVGDELRVLVNRPGSDGDTVQLSLRKSAAGSPEIVELPSLPLVAAGAALCGQELVVSGSDSAGGTVIVVLDRLGKPARTVRVKMNGLIVPPLPVCQPGPGVIWQAVAKQVEIADLAAGCLVRQRSLPIGGGEWTSATAQGKTWIAWGESDAIRGFEIGASARRPFRIAATQPRRIALGTCVGQLCVAYAEGRSVFLVTRAAADKPDRPAALDLGEAAEGRLAVVSGPQALVWAQRLIYEGHGGPDNRWVTALSAPGKPPLLVEGLTQSIARWGDRTVLVGSDALYVLR